MWRKSRQSGKWHEAGAAEWPELPTSEANRCRHDRCEECNRPKPTLYPQPTADKFGRPTVRRVCVGCMGRLNGRRAEVPAGEPVPVGRPISQEPLVQEAYTMQELAALVSRDRKTVCQVANRLGLGHFSNQIQKHYRHRVVTREEAEQVRQFYLALNLKQATKKCGEKTTTPNFGTLPKTKDKAQRYAEGRGR